MDHDAPHFTFKPEHDKTNKMTCARSKDSGQSGHPHSLIRVIVHCLGSQWPTLPSVGQRRLWPPLNFTFEWVHCNWIKYQMPPPTPLPHPTPNPAKKTKRRNTRSIWQNIWNLKNIVLTNPWKCINKTRMGHREIYLYFLKYEKKQKHFEWQHYFENIILIHVI